MKILFLTSHLPFPPISGGRRREYELLRRLGKRHQIEICIISRTYEYDLLHIKAVQKFAKVHLFRASTDIPDAEAFPKTENSSFLVRRNLSPEAKGFVSSRLGIGDIDLVHCEGYYMHHLVQGVACPVFTMEQNIEYLIWSEEAAKILKEEVEVWELSTRCGVITQEDASVMEKYIGSTKTLISFNGCDHRTHLGFNEKLGSRKAIPSGLIVLFPGNFAYRPTYEAGYDICMDIAPKILNKVPNSTVLLVGNCAEKLDPFIKHPRIIVHGRVQSLETYYKAASIVAYPLKVGGGIKVKVTEALNRRCPIVTTNVGLQGLHGAPVITANCADDFLETVVKLLTNHSYRKKMIRQITKYAATLPTWDMAAQCLHKCWKQVVEDETSVL